MTIEALSRESFPGEAPAPDLLAQSAVTGGGMGPCLDWLMQRRHR